MEITLCMGPSTAHIEEMAVAGGLSRDAIDKFVESTEVNNVTYEVDRMTGVASVAKLNGLPIQGVD